MIKRKITLYTIFCFGLASCQTNTIDTTNTTINTKRSVDSIVTTTPELSTTKIEEPGDTSLTSFLANFKEAIIQKNSIALHQMSNEANVDKSFYEVDIFFEEMKETLDNITVDKLKKEEGYWIINSVVETPDGEPGSGIILYIKKIEGGSYTIDRVLAAG